MPTTAPVTQAIIQITQIGTARRGNSIFPCSSPRRITSTRLDPSAAPTSRSWRTDPMKPATHTTVGKTLGLVLAAGLLYFATLDSRHAFNPIN